jgi:uncharacterized membrane protein
MAQTRVASGFPVRPFADRVVHVGLGAPFRWLAAGCRDFWAGLGASLAYGMIFVMAGLVLAVALVAVNMMYLFVPLVTGFMLVGPAATLGFYAISRDLEAGRQPSFANALRAYKTMRWSPDFGQEVKLGLLLRRTDLDDEQTEAVFGGVQGEGCS